jgi:hypothetical protein
MSKISNDRYFASHESEQLPEVLAAKAEAFRDKLDRMGKPAVWKRAERTYYGYDGTGGLANSVAVTFVGDEGEQVTARINHFRSICQAIIAMVTSSRPAFKARAINTDVESLQQTSLAEGVVDWVYRSKNIEDMRIEQVERAIVSGEGYLHLRWDPYIGRVMPQPEGQPPPSRPVYGDDGQLVMETVADPNAPADPSGLQEPPMVEQPKMEPWPMREGDVAPSVLGPLEVVRDLNDREMKWCMVPHRESVWTLMARFPQVRADIFALKGQPQWPRRIWCDTTLEQPEEDDDSVTVWCFYHPPCDALPAGRYVVFVGQIVLYDKPWPFGDEIPVYQLLPMREMGSAQGHSPLWDLLCLQELYDACFTSLANATEGRGEGNVLAPKGSDVDVTMLARGYQLIEYDHVEGAYEGGRPTALTGLFDVPPDAYKIEEILKRTMETLSGVNSVTRGDPNSNLKSGAALALVQSLTQHFNSSLQSGVTRNDERVGTGILKLYQRFSPIPRLAEITGQQGKTALKEFTSANLAAIQRVTVEMGNPAMRGPGGVEMAMDLVKGGIVTDLSQFFELVESGRIEPLFDENRDEMRQVRRENESLASGQPVPVNDGDRDDIHVRHHRRVYDDPEVRANPAIMQAVTKHIEQHMAALGQKPIELMWAIGQEIPPWRAPAPPGEGPPGGPPPDGPTDGTPGSPTSPPVERAQPLGGEAPPGGPLMPVNPLDGERAPAGPQ